jgi:Uma2 family endonuclease
MAPQTSTKLTYEDYLLLPDDGRRHEIIDGEHHVSPSPNMRHQRLSKRIVAALLPYEKLGLGEVFYAPATVVLSPSNIVEPDVFFITRERSHLVTEKNVQGAPDLVVEILSGSNREYDKRVKRKTYERYGVAEYWIVDGDDRTVTIYRRSGAAFVESLAAESVTTPLIPGFSLALRDLFA